MADPGLPRCGCATCTSTGCGSTRPRRLRLGRGARGGGADAARARGRPARARHRRVGAQRPEGDPACEARRLELRCAVGRRLPPRGARTRHRRARGLLRGVRPRRAARQGLRSPVRARRRLLGLPPPSASGAPAPDRKPEQFVVFDQNHDQVGNRAFRRPASSRARCGSRSLRAAVAVHADAVHGEEYGERAPFQFFSDHIDKRIAKATREGRRREFAAFAAFAGEELPDPQAPETFAPRSSRARARGAMSSSCAS